MQSVRHAFSCVQRNLFLVLFSVVITATATAIDVVDASNHTIVHTEDSPPDISEATVEGLGDANNYTIVHPEDSLPDISEATMEGPYDKELNAEVEELVETFDSQTSRNRTLAGELLLPVNGPAGATLLPASGTVIAVIDPRTDGFDYKRQPLLRVLNARSRKTLIACTENVQYSGNGGDANPHVGYTWEGHPYCYFASDKNTWYPGRGGAMRLTASKLVGWWYIQSSSFLRWVPGPAYASNGNGYAIGWSPTARQLRTGAYQRENSAILAPRVRVCRALYGGSWFIGEQVTGINGCTFSLIALGSARVVTELKAWQLLRMYKNYARPSTGACGADCNGNYNWPPNNVGLAGWDLFEGLFYQTVDAGACCRLCRATYGCNAWTYSFGLTNTDVHGTEASPGGCSLKDLTNIDPIPGSPPTPALAKSKPGSCPAMPKGQYYYSMTGIVHPSKRRNAALDVKGCSKSMKVGWHINLPSMGSGARWLKTYYTRTLRACCAKCKATPNCAAFSFQRIWLQCYLYDNRWTPSNSPGDNFANRFNKFPGFIAGFQDVPRARCNGPGGRCN